MTMTDDIRWQQRFHNYEKAFLLLARALNIATPSEVERGGIIQFYEMAFELAWKLMKDYLEHLGYTVNSPRDAIKQAFQVGILDDGQLWMDALSDRNLTTHTYDENKAIEVVAKIRSHYFPALQQLYRRLSSELN
ncbi:nucleotidyltransferase substrate binding protein [Methylobacter sp.]|uniref:nucleotidyltransferase substrate binding protein n=1 Tax=Methylobacter sp. TaxID=2051955 RepID=UPI002488C523|nr:nucleotidyltransferase substrate binding protein [Methylobacter sp.]MDI1279000.1 nucleotidyltransferase substrate binding protein [Methylobacter sp.]MDI1359810.1 nucleotidyltransferase substrate binding protein [Methylobacter sp.]